MIALKIINTKNAMNELLAKETFHHFCVSEITLVNGFTLTLDGHISGTTSPENSPSQAEIFQKEYPFSLATWCKIQPLIYDAIKGKIQPSYIKFVFCLAPDQLDKTIAACTSNLSRDEISGMYINMVYQNSYITVTTGVSYKIFTKDKDLESKWDSMVIRFLAQNGIDCEEIQ